MYCGGEGVEYVNLQSRIVNNLDETITVSLYMSNQSSIKDLELKQHSFFDLGNFDLNDCDSLDVKFANNKGIRLYSGHTGLLGFSSLRAPAFYDQTGNVLLFR